MVDYAVTVNMGAAFRTKLDYTAATANLHLGIEDSAGVFSNAGAAGAVTFFMDDTVAGVNYVICLVEAQDVFIDPPAGTTITFDGTTHTTSIGITSSTAGAWASVIATSTTTWLVVSHSANWALI